MPNQRFPSNKKRSKKTESKFSRTATTRTRKKSAGKPINRKKKSGRRPTAAFMGSVTPGPQLAEVVGSKPLPRTELTKKLWAYIKRNGLQDKDNRRMVNADERLRPIFGGRSSVKGIEIDRLVDESQAAAVDPGLRALAHLYSKL